MTKEQALGWIYTQMRANEYQAIETEGVCRAGVTSHEVHVYKGLRALASALDIPYTVTTRKDSEYPVRTSFEFEGYTFFQIGRTLADATDVRNS